MKDYKDWVVWQKSMNLVEDVYKATKQFPKEEMHGLTSQIRRAVVSIPSNIAEGYARITKKDKAYFYRIAFASSKEVETQIEIARRLKYISDSESNDLTSLLTEVIKMLSKMVFSEY